MADSRFYSSQGPFSLEQLASIAEARIEGASGADSVFSDVRPLSIAGAGDVSFLDNPRYVSAFSESKAGACLVHPEHTTRAPGGMALLVTEEPYRAYARIAAAFYPMAPIEPGISENAQIDKTAKLGADVRIEANAVIGAGVTLGDGTGVGAGAVISPNVIIGGGAASVPMWSWINVSLAIGSSSIRAWPSARTALALHPARGGT